MPAEGAIGTALSGKQQNSGWKSKSESGKETKKKGNITIIKRRSGLILTDYELYLKRERMILFGNVINMVRK